MLCDYVTEKKVCYCCVFQNGLFRMASHKLSRSTVVFRPLPACLLTPSPSSMHILIAQTVERNRQSLRPHFLSLSRTKKCRNFYPIVSLRSHLQLHNNNKPFFSMLQSRIGQVKQKPNNNCQATRIANLLHINLSNFNYLNYNEKNTRINFND